MTPDEQRIIEQITHNLSGLRGALIGTNMSQSDLKLLLADISRMQWCLEILLQEGKEEAAHADD